jgi:hypothetical protein
VVVAVAAAPPDLVSADIDIRIQAAVPAAVSLNETENTIAGGYSVLVRLYQLDWDTFK